MTRLKTYAVAYEIKTYAVAYEIHLSDIIWRQHLYQKLTLSVIILTPAMKIAEHLSMQALVEALGMW